MAPPVADSRFPSLSCEDYKAIDVCNCEDIEDISPRPSVFSSSPTYESFDSIIISRKENKRNRSQHGRYSHRTRRILRKNGRANEVLQAHRPLRLTRFIRDLGNTVVNTQWRWATLILVVSFWALWLLFAWFWMLIGTSNGDLDDPKPNKQCLVGIQGFAGYLLMSVETQTTIGYGSRYPTEHCPEGIFLLCLQMILGIGVHGIVLGMCYAKMARPGQQDISKLFSKTAVVCLRDGVLCLMFRVGDTAKGAHIVGTQIRAYILGPRRTAQGELILAYQSPLRLEDHGLLLWPLVIVHPITSDSPLYDLSAKDLLTQKLEIVVIMVGSSNSTGQLTQTRTSYLPSEIHWGHRFKPCVTYDNDKQAYIVHQELFNATEEVDTPLCSASRLQEVIEELQEECDIPFTPTILSSPTDSFKMDSTLPSDIFTTDTDSALPLSLPTDTSPYSSLPNSFSSNRSTPSNSVVSSNRSTPSLGQSLSRNSNNFSPIIHLEEIMETHI